MAAYYTYYTSLSSNRTYEPISRQFTKTEFFVGVWVKAIGCILLTTNRTHLSRHLCKIEIEGCVCVCGWGLSLKNLSQEITQKQQIKQSPKPQLYSL
jgi:hypothetical protein